MTQHLNPPTHTDPFEHWPQTGAPGSDRGALDTVVSCFAGSIGADTATLVAAGDTGELPRLISSWDRGEGRAVPAWTRGTFLAQALSADGAIVERDPSARQSSVPVSAVAAAVHANGRVLGAIHAGFGTPSATPAEELCWRTEAYARLAALCLKGDVALRGAFHAPRTDVLTGCLSYGSLIETVGAELQRSARRGHAVSCCFLDLDGFKRINDERGHLEGNRVLSAAGRAVREAARGYDSVGRFGGDEFVVLLPETEMAGACRFAERLRDGIRAALRSETPVEVDVSIGVAEWDREVSPIGLLDEADRALAAAKRNGGAAVATARNGDGDRRLISLLARTRAAIRPRGARGPRP